MKKTHKLISILIVLAMLLSVAPLSFVTTTAAEITMSEPVLTTDKYDINGDGTNDAVYEITDVSELYWFANLVNTKAKDGGNNKANAILMNNITVNENVIVDGALTSDTSSLNVWTAMGKTVFSSGWYGGWFDGNGKTISGLYVNETNNYRGFIGCIGEGGGIKNLTIEDSYFTSTTSSLGAFVGTMGLNSAAVKPVIENCKLTGSIVSGTSYVGGIAGGADYGEIISNCHMYNSTIIGTGDNVGGIVGNAGDYNNETYIRLCSVNGGSVIGANKVGGIIGCGYELSKTKISACCNYGTSVTATTRYAGGILGEDGYCYSCFVTAEVSAPKNKGPFAGYGNHYYSACDSDIYGEGINHISSKSFTTEEIEAGIATYFLTDTTPSNTVYVLWGQRIGEDKYPSWNPDGNQDYIVYRVDDTENGGYIYYNGDAAAEYEPNEDGIYEIANRSDWYKFAKKAKEDTAIDAVLTANIDFSGVGSDKLDNYVIGVDQKAYTGTFDGDGYTVSNLPDATHPLFNIIGNGGELKDLNLSGATVTNTDTVSIAGLVCNNQGTVSNVTVTDVTVSGIYSAGIVYYNYGTVTGCTASDITVTGKTTVGGIVGVNNNGKTIENCHVLSGTVKAENADGYDGHAGGICGRSSGGTIKGCSNGADVSSEASRLETAAGIVGKPATYNDVSVNIIECYNTGDINGNCAGGISGADLTSTHVNISLCYNEGNITGNVAGGIAADGSINATDKIINCYNAGEIKAVGTEAKAGGIVGNHSNSSIQNCHNYGKVISEYLAAPISCTNVGTWHGTDELINNYAIEGNIQAPNISPYLDTAGAASNFDAVVKGSTREEFADGTVTAKLNAGNSETVWYQYTHYPILEERHVHQWSYTSEGTDTIKAECVLSGCDLSNNYGGTISIKAPADLLFNGNSMDAECIYTDWLPTKPAVVYNDVDRVNVTGQDIVASVTLGKGTDAVSVNVNYQITPRELIASMVTLSPSSTSYSGSEKTVTVTVKYDSSTTLVSGADYEVSGTASATDVGTYTVSVIGKGNYSGTIEKTWKITKASVRPQILIDGWSYLDTPNTPTVNNNPENGEVIYTYYITGGRRPVMTGAENGAETEGGVPKYAGAYYIGATIAETEHYNAATITPTKQFVISPRAVTNPTFEGLQATYVYDNGNEIKPSFTVKDDLGNVIPESEYTVTYSDNTDAGEATITITNNADGNYNVSGTAKFTIIIHQHDWTYAANGNVITATCSNSDGGCTDTNGGTFTISAPADLYADGTTAKEVVIDNQLVESVDYSVTYSTADGLAPKTAGTYTASVTIGGATATVKFTLVKPNASVSTVPVANALTYNREAQALVTAGSSSDGEIQYSLDGATYSSDIPAATNAGDYTVYYKVIGDENHNDSEPATVTVTISPANIYDATVTQVNPLYYNGTMQYVELAVSFDGKTLVYMTDYFLVGRAGGTDAGTYNTTVIGQGNYKGEKTIEWYIEKATPTADMLVFTAPENLTYDGSEKSATVEASPEITGMGEITVKYSATPVNAGTYTVSIDVAEGSNYNAISDLEIGEFTIIKADNTVTAAPTPKTLTYNGEEQNLISEGSSESGTVVYSLDGAEYSETIPTGINAGEYTIYYKVIGDANHNDTEPETLTVTIGKKSVTVSATVPDRIYGDDYQVDTSKVVVTFDGVVDGDNVGYVVIDAYYHAHTVTDNAPVQVVYNVNGADAGNYQFPEYGDWMAPNYPVEATGKVLPRDIADAEIVLGDALIYNGAEQTQSISGVTVDGLEVTYTVSGNTVTNVGVYELTITGNGNFTGTKTALFEIAPDTSAIDALTVDNVKSSDKEAIEAVVNQIENADTENADEDNISEYNQITEKCNELLAKITETEEKLEEINGVENNYNPETVTSDDKAEIEEIIAEIESVNPENLTDEQKAEYDEIKAGFEALLEKIEKAGSEVDAVGAELEMFDEEKVTIFQEDEIEALKAKIDELLADENMGEAEKAKLNEYKAQCDNLIEIINTPAKYLSMRLFYFIWDALHWLSSHVVFIFNWIVAMF